MNIIIKKFHYYVLSQYFIQLKINTIIIKIYFPIKIQDKVVISLFNAISSTNIFGVPKFWLNWSFSFFSFNLVSIF